MGILPGEEGINRRNATRLRQRRSNAAWLLPILVVMNLSLPVARATGAGKQSGQADEERALPESIVTALHKQDCGFAAPALENFLFDHPGHGEAVFQLAFCYTLLGRSEDATELYRELLLLEPKHYRARINLGVLLANAKDYPGAGEQFLAATEIEPGDFRAHFYFATALEGQGVQDQALEQYARAAELDPSQPEARAGIARLIAARGDLVAAGPLLDHLLTLAPTDLDFVELRAEGYRLEDKHAEVLALYDRYLAAAEESQGAPPEEIARVEYNAGLEAHALGRYEQALEHHERAGEIGGGEMEWASATGRARALAALGRYDEAIPCYRRAIMLMGDDWDIGLIADYGHVLFEASQYEAAVVVLWQVVDADPKREDAFNEMAFAFHQTEQYEGVVRTLKLRAQHHAETPGTLFLQALAYDHLQQCADAIAFYERFLEANQGEKNDQFFQATGRLRAIKKTCKP